MNKTNKWIPVTVLFCILLLCGLLIFAAIGESSRADEPPNTDSPQSTSTPADSTSGTSSSPADTPSATPPAVTEPVPPALDLNAKFPLYDVGGTRIAEVSVEEYLCGALLSALSFTYPPSALEAQAVALRTDVWARLAAGGVLSVATYGYTDRAALLPTWGTDFTETIWARAEAAVTATRGQVLTDGGALYTFGRAGEASVLLAETDIGTAAKTADTAELLAFFYPSATFTKNS